jgi:hypothetical protein
MVPASLVNRPLYEWPTTRTEAARSFCTSAFSGSRTVIPARLNTPHSSAAGVGVLRAEIDEVIENLNLALA